jgi:adenosylhomocysteine nucleosidase
VRFYIEISFKPASIIATIVAIIALELHSRDKGSFMITEKSKIAVVCASTEEYLRCKANFKPQKEIELNARRVCIWANETLDVSIIHAGPGKIQCASATQLLIDKITPEIIIETGAAGSLNPANKIGTVVCIQNCFEYDVCEIEHFDRLAQDLTTTTLAANPVGPIREALTEFSRIAVGTSIVPSIIFGDIASGEMNVKDAVIRDQLRTAFNAVVCSWETAAVLKTASLNGVACLSFRAVTDNADENAASDYKTNLHNSLDGLMHLLKEFFCAGWATKITKTLHYTS